MNNNLNRLTLCIDLDYEKLSKSELFEFLKMQYNYYYKVKRLSTGSNIFKKVNILYIDSHDNITRSAKDFIK